MIVRIEKTPVAEGSLLSYFTIFDTSFKRIYGPHGGLLMMSITREIEALYLRDLTSYHRNLGRFYAYLLRHQMTACDKTIILSSYCVHPCSRRYFEHYLRTL